MKSFPSKDKTEGLSSLGEGGCDVHPRSTPENRLTDAMHKDITVYIRFQFKSVRLMWKNCFLGFFQYFSSTLMKLLRFLIILISWREMKSFLFITMFMQTFKSSALLRKYLRILLRQWVSEAEAALYIITSVQHIYIYFFRASGIYCEPLLVSVLIELFSFELT